MKSCDCEATKKVSPMKQAFLEDQRSTRIIHLKRRLPAKNKSTWENQLEVKQRVSRSIVDIRIHCDDDDDDIDTNNSNEDDEDYKPPAKEQKVKKSSKPDQITKCFYH